MTSRIEAAIQRALVAWIKLTYPHIRVIATLNENSRHQVNMGVDVGITDLLLKKIHEDLEHTFYLELKKKKGRLSASEIDWAAEYVPAKNTHYGVAYGFAQAKEMVTQWMAL